MIIKRIYLILASFITVVLVLINLRYYSYTPVSGINDKTYQTKEVSNQLNYLYEEMHYNNADIEMQKLYPEGYIFMNALYGLTWCETAINDKSDNLEIHKKAVDEANYALKNLESDESKHIFNKESNPPYGIFYHSWTNYLRAKLLFLTCKENDTVQIKNYLDECNLIAAVLDSIESPYPETYRNASWPADVLPGIVSLRIHDMLFTPKYDKIIAIWLYKVRSKLDPGTGLLPHSAETYTGSPAEGARGSSQSLIIRLLSEVDTSFALEQYLLFRRKFAGEILGLVVIREYSLGTDNNGDVDSGPVIFGAGSSATLAALGTARSCGDMKLASSLERTIETTGMAFTWNNKKKYLLGQLPMADMFIAWSKSTPCYFTGKENNLTENQCGGNKLLIYSLSLIIILMMVFLMKNVNLHKVKEITHSLPI